MGEYVRCPNPSEPDCPGQVFMGGGCPTCPVCGWSKCG